VGRGVKGREGKEGEASSGMPLRIISGYATVQTQPCTYSRFLQYARSEQKVPGCIRPIGPTPLLTNINNCSYNSIAALLGYVSSISKELLFA